MAYPADQVRDNPWWRRREAVEDDPDLVRLREQPARFDHDIPFDLTVDAIYTLRGPRQVGKSTLLKRIARALLVEEECDPRDLFYLDAEAAGIETATELRETLDGFLDWSRSPGGQSRRYLLLDEITGVRDWGTCVKILHRRGQLDGVTAIVTGSHALDLRRGGETAPGRRGERHGVPLDWVMMPFGFRDYVFAHAADLEGEIPELPVEHPRRAYEAAGEIALWEDTVRPLFQRFLLTGGYPHAMAAEQSRGRIPDSIYDLYERAVVGQVKRAGYREGYFRELVAWAADGRLGSEFSWRDASGETRIGSKDTARRYLEDAGAMFLWHVYYRAQSPEDTAPALRSPKKLYPADPFGWHVLASWVGRARDRWADAMRRLETGPERGLLTESVTADHFRRARGHGALYHRASQGDEEIDFVLSGDGGPSYVEVKFRQRIRRKHRRWLSKYGGGILATRDRLEWHGEDNVASVPLYALLAGFSEPVSLYPSSR